MANVSVYNMEGKEVGTIELNDAVFGVEVNEHWYTWQLYSSLQIIVRELRKQRPVLRYPVAEESPGDRREPVMQDRVQPDLPVGRRRRSIRSRSQRLLFQA